MRDLLRELRAQDTATRAEIRDPPVRRPWTRQDLMVQRVVGLLHAVAALVEAPEVELGLVVQPRLPEPDLRDGLEAVRRILQPVYARDLVAVERRDGNLLHDTP